jgi:hypothetical protein
MTETGAAGPERKEWALGCAIARKMLAQFDQRRRTDPLYQAAWSSLTPLTVP